jgi:hypothetical protein
VPFFKTKKAEEYATFCAIKGLTFFPLFCLTNTALILCIYGRKIAYCACAIIFKGKGKKRAVGWFPASYVKLLEGGGGSSGAAATNGGDKPADTDGTASSEYRYSIIEISVADPDSESGAFLPHGSGMIFSGSRIRLLFLLKCSYINFRILVMLSL